MRSFYHGHSAYFRLLRYLTSLTLCVWLMGILLHLLLMLASLTPPPSIASEDREERHTQIPADQGITDFGPLPRERYPLVAVLTLAEPEARDTYNIVSPSQH